tara:strand:+ start:519 stop:1796 length:1278 start_codon:yes stop_codon:yes gene_type:complete
MRNRFRSLGVCLLLSSLFSLAGLATAADYTPGKLHNYSHEDGTVEKNNYQYSIFVPKDYDPKTPSPLVFYLHGGGKGRTHPSQGHRNMLTSRLKDNKRATDAGYSRNQPGSGGYILVSPVKPIAYWRASVFKRLVAHVRSKVNIDKNRIYVTGFSMGGQGTWFVACGTDGSYRIAAMMPLGAWGCHYVRPGKTVKSCKTLGTPTWVLHCPLDNVSKISEQLPLFQNHVDLGGYGRFTMIPGKGHKSRPPNDTEFLSLRMSWMLSQTYGTPFNYILQVNDGRIDKISSGKRPFTADTGRHGFYEPGTVVNITAPKSKDGKPFMRWAAAKGRFANAKSRSTSYKTAGGDVVISAIYGSGSYKLTVVGGKAKPSSPKAGQVVTVIPASKKFYYWTTSTPLVDIAIPTNRSFQFAMPSADVTLTAQTKN